MKTYICIVKTIDWGNDNKLSVIFYHDLVKNFFQLLFNVDGEEFVMISTCNLRKMKYSSDNITMNFAPNPY